MSLFGDIWEGIKDAAEGTVNTVVKVGEFVVDTAKAGFDALGSAFAGAAEALGGAVNDAVGAISSVVNHASTIVGDFGNDLLGVATAIGSAFADVASAAGEAVVDAYGTFKHTVSDGLNTLQNTLDKLTVLPIVGRFNPFYIVSNVYVNALISYVNYSIDLYGRVYNAASDLSWDRLTHNPLGELRQIASDALDVLGATDTFEFLYRSINFTTRSLTDDERNAAEQVFGDSIDLGAVRVNNHDIVRGIGELLKHNENLGAYTTFHTINIWEQNPTVELIMHEFVHVWQYEHIGADYIVGALADAQGGVLGYDYGGPAGLRTAMDNGQGLVPPPYTSSESPHFDNLESMADIVRHYAMLRLNLDGVLKADKDPNVRYIDVNSPRGAASDIKSVHYVIHEYDLPMYAQFVSEVSSLPLEQLSPPIIYAANASDNTYSNELENGIERIYGNRLDNEIHAGRGGQEVIKGGGGTDTVVFQGPVGEFTIIPQTDGRYTATASRTAGSGVYDLYDIAQVQFDGSAPISIDRLVGGGQTGIGTAATPLSVGNDLNPNVASPGDVNRFSTVLTAGTTYWFNAEGSSTGRGSIPDPYLRLLGVDGVTELAFDQGSGIGSNSFVSLTPTETGTYYTIAGSSSSSTGSYFLWERVADDSPNNPATTGILTPGGSVTGTYDFVADTDWFRTALKAGATYRFDMDSTPTGPETDIQPRLKLYGPGGTTQLAADNNDRGESKASITFTPTTTGTYYVSAESFGSHVGTYRLSEDVISGVTPLAAPVSRLAFASALDVTAAPSGSANGTAALLADLGVPSISPDQFFAGALPATQPQYVAGDGDTQPSGASLAAVALNQPRDVSAFPYSSAWP